MNILYTGSQIVRQNRLMNHEESKSPISKKVIFNKQ